MCGESILPGLPARPAAEMPVAEPWTAGPRDSAAEISAFPATARKRFWFLVRLIVAAILLAWLAKSGLIDVRGLSRPFTAWPIALTAMALILTDSSLMALRFSLLFRPIGLQLTWGKSFQLALVSSFFAQFLPGSAGTDLARLFYTTKDTRGRRSEVVTVSLFDRGVGMLSLLIAPLLFAPAYARFIASSPALRAVLLSAAGLAAVLISGFLAIVFFQPFMERLARALFGFLPWKDWHAGVIRTVAGYRGHLGAVAAALGLSIAANTANLIVMVLAILALNPASLNWKVGLVIPLGFVVNSLPFTPGGLGVGETAFNGLFTLAGLAGGAEALLCWRVWTALVRLIGLVFYLRGIESLFHSGVSSRTPIQDDTIQIL